VVNILGDRKALYRVGEFYRDKDLETMFDEDVAADAFRVIVEGQILRFWPEEDGLYDLSRLLRLAVSARSHTLSPAGAPEDEWAKFTHWKGIHAERELDVLENVDLAVTVASAKVVLNVMNQVRQEKGDGGIIVSDGFS
jgi:hypothetical protein